jgi:hypothetical protein
MPWLPTSTIREMVVPYSALKERLSDVKAFLDELYRRVAP